ncbi:MAG TPA: hypothetical protein VG347_23590 [Verrucomicrobiae bacterium]|nr:hypothetical protein [Verrucomicrobiae bacterium]
MKIKSLVVGLTLLGMAALFSSCIGLGTKFSTPTDDDLVLGKIKPDDALKRFGQPYAKTTKATRDGAYTIYKYDFALSSFGTVSSRVLLLEFKGDVLNAYFWWSSFSQDKTTVNTNVFEKLQGGIGKLAKAEVLAMAGKPSGKGYCPSTIGDFKENCETNSEIWDWYMEDHYEINGDAKTPKSQQLSVTFDAEGKVAGVQTVEFRSLGTARFFSNQ